MLLTETLAPAAANAGNARYSRAMRPPRVAFFPDSFHEVNGVAHTSRHFVAYTQRRELPLLCVRAGIGAGKRKPVLETREQLTTLELPRSRASVGMEKDLSFDPIFWRHADLIEDALYRFKPDLLHLTGPSELGIFAAYFAWKLKLPLAASWHTNIHEYAARRLTWLTRLLPGGFGEPAGRLVEDRSLDAILRFYALAKVLYAPNPGLCELLARRTGRPCHLMQRGVDTVQFSPAHRTAAGNRKPFRLGYVGRLSIEKNVALLPIIQRELTAAGIAAHFVIIGHGAEEESLRQALPGADFTGVLRGEALARAYADMDLFVFPSHTDTFGNVVLEALASGVPAIVTPDGGPGSIVRDGITGSIVPDAGFASAITRLLADPAQLARMRLAARDHALTCSWDAVFDSVYQGYRPLLRDLPCRTTGTAASSSPG